MKYTNSAKLKLELPRDPPRTHSATDGDWDDENDFEAEKRRWFREQARYAYHEADCSYGPSFSRENPTDREQFWSQLTVAGCKVLAGTLFVNALLIDFQSPKTFD